MPSIRITNIQNGAVLGQNFTVYGDFSLAYAPTTSGPKTTYRIERAVGAIGTRAVVAVKCYLQTALGGPISAVNGFQFGSSWQVDFQNQAAGNNLKLIPEVVVDGTPFRGTAVTGLVIRAAQAITISATPPPPGPGSRKAARAKKNIKPNGDTTIAGGDFLEFRSVTVDRGREAPDEITILDLEVNNTKKKWKMKTKQHEYEDTGHATHVIYVKTKQGERITTSRVL